MKKRVEVPTVGEKLYSVAEVAKFLNRSYATAYRLISNNEISHCKIKASMLVSEAQLQAYLNRNTISAEVK